MTNDVMRVGYKRIKEQAWNITRWQWYKGPANQHMVMTITHTHIEDNIKYINSNNIYLIIYFFCNKWFFSQDHPRGKRSHQNTMSHVTKHHSKQEWKCNYSIWCCKIHIQINNFYNNILDRM